MGQLHRDLAVKTIPPQDVDCGFRRSPRRYIDGGGYDAQGEVGLQRAETQTIGVSGTPVSPGI